MAVLDPVKLIIDNYPEDQMEYMDVVNNQENEALGTRKVPFGRELYIEQRRFHGRTAEKIFPSLSGQ